MSDSMFAAEVLVGKFTTLHALAEQLKAKSGSQAARKRDAGLTVLGATFSLEAGEDLPLQLVNLHHVLKNLVAPKGGSIGLGDLATHLANFNEWAEHIHGEAVNAYLTAQGKPEDLGALKEAYASAVEECKAVLRVAEFMPEVKALVDNPPEDNPELFTIPTIRAPRGSGSPRTTGTKRGHFYRIVNGERKDQSTQQDKLSSVAWYFGAIMTGLEPGKGSTNEGKGVPTPDLEKYLRANVTDSPLGKSWEYSVTIGEDVVVFGYEVKGDDTATDEEE